MVRDIGSIFYTLKEGDLEMDRFTKTKPSFMENSFYHYYTGRHAIHSILKHLNSYKPIDKIWLPSYFCHNVINSVRSRYSNVHFYESQPFNLGGDHDLASFAGKDDVVLLNNYWGCRSFEGEYNKSTGPTIIEDHSHGWLTEACIKSKADYCIASIRKSYPIPLGAVVWRPDNKPFNPGYESDISDSIFTAIKNLSLAQELKRNYIKKGELSLQTEFLALLGQGENEVSDSKAIIEPHDDFLGLIRPFMELDPNSIKRSNLNYILDNLKSSRHFQCLAKPDVAPFGLILLFKEENYFKSFKAEMIQQNIYPAHLWPNNDQHLYGYLINIHLDFRYNEKDMGYLVKNINAWINLNG